MATNCITSVIAAATVAVGFAAGLSPNASAHTRPNSADAPKREIGGYTYGWPVKPFARQHPVRGFFGDPRIADAHGATTKQFHFGVDVSAPNGTPVYATITGTVSFINDEAISVAGPAGVVFEYWHIVPTVRPGQHVTAYRSVVGHVAAPWAHVHFSERRSGEYVNPLRPDGMGPFTDHTTPRVEAIHVRPSRDGITLIADVADDTPMLVAEPWSNLPVMPAVVRWRLAGGPARMPWQTVVDFRLHIPVAGLFSSVYASTTRQNHAARPGLYRVVLGRPGSGLSGDLGHRIEVETIDSRGNRAIASSPLVAGTQLVRG